MLVLCERGHLLKVNNYCTFDGFDDSKTSMFLPL